MNTELRALTDSEIEFVCGGKGPLVVVAPKIAISVPVATIVQTNAAGIVGSQANLGGINLGSLAAAL
jgi:hypothetical protein